MNMKERIHYLLKTYEQTDLDDFSAPAHTFPALGTSP